MNERELRAEIVQSGNWLYDSQIPTEVWIVKQNFEYHFELGYSDEPEELNEDGDAYQVIMTRCGQVLSVGPARLSLMDAIKSAEEIVPAGIDWTNHTLQKLYGARSYSLKPLHEE